MGTGSVTLTDCLGKTMLKVKEVLEEIVRLGYRIDDNGDMYNPKGNLIKGCVTNGYRKVGLRVLDFKSFSLKIHRFQGYKKYGDRIFREGMQIRHLDEDPLNNSWDNIAIGTARDNMMDMTKEAREVKADKAWRAANPREKSEREYIYDLLYSGVPYKEIRRNYNVALGTLSYMKNKSKEYKKYIKNKPVC